MVLPLAIIETGRRSLDAVADEVATRAAKEEVEGIVVGLPLNMDGSEGAQSLQARAFGSRLSTRSRLPVEYWDERLSTFRATERLLSAEFGSRGTRKGRRVDDQAAVAMLESYVAAAATCDMTEQDPDR
jgi:putative Holliday junction resolvase